MAFTDGYEGTDRAKLTRPCKGGEGMGKMHCRIDDAPERARNVRSNGNDAARAVCVFFCASRPWDWDGSELLQIRRSGSAARASARMHGGVAVPDLLISALLGALCLRFKL